VQNEEKNDNMYKLIDHYYYLMVAIEYHIIHKYRSEDIVEEDQVLQLYNVLMEILLLNQLHNRYYDKQQYNH
jgi:hypothetical protein